MREAGRIKNRKLRWRGVVVTAAVVCALSCGCQKNEQPAVSAGPTKFASPESAGQAVYNAAKADDRNAVLAIFGPDGKDFLLTEDASQDKSSLDQFCSDYEQMHRWANTEDGAMVLDIGAENYPFPFPLIKTSDGQWVFSSDHAKKEMLAREIGANELNVIDVLNEMADAQTEYFAKMHDGSKVKQYAQRFISKDGKHDGLYWVVAEGAEESPLGPMVGRAAAEGYERGTKDNPQPFHGYFYRILKEQGAHADGGAKSYLVNGNMTKGFAILAYPADYRKSGVMTFVIGTDGRVFQKDLGDDSVATAKATTAFDPDDTWTLVE
jgi:hypothetical protein